MSTVKEILYGTQPVYRKNFIRENVKHLRDMQNYYQSDKKAGFSGLRTHSGRYLASKPRSQSSQPRSRGQNFAMTMNKVERPTTAFSSSINHLKKQCNEKPVCSSSSSRGPVPFHQTKRPEAQFPLHKDKVAAGSKRETCKNDRHNSNSAKSANSWCLLTGKKPGVEALPPMGMTTLKAYKDASSQTVEIQTVGELYEEGVIIYPSSKVLTNSRLALDRPICLDSASQTDKDCHSVDICVPPHRVPTNQICSDEVDDLNIQRMNLEDGKENIQGQHIIAVNSKRSSSKQKCASVPCDPLKAPTTYQKGIVPRYLRERQQQWQKAAEDELANAPDPSCPAGHVLLPEEERTQTLDMIKRDYANMVRELNMMPVRADTLRIRQRKIDLEQKLTNLEEAVKVFSRPKVFVKVGE